MGQDGLLAGLSPKGPIQIKTGTWRWMTRPAGLIAIGVLVLAGIVWYGFYATHTREISGSDDREYASIANNILHGKGIVRNAIYPLEINFFKKFPIPEFVHPPGYSLMLAGFFKLFGISDFAALLPSYLSFFGLVLLLFFFVKKYSGEKQAALATIILILNRQILDLSLVALTEAAYTAVFFLFFAVFVNSKSLRDIFLAGILLGLSHMIRENLYPFLLPLLIYLYFYPDLPHLPRWRKMAVFIVGLLIPIFPNIIRTYLEMKSPFFSYGKFVLMAFTDKYPWLNIYREIQSPSLIEFLTRHPGQFILKYVTNFAKLPEQVMSFSNPFLMAFFLLEMFHWKISPEWKRVKLLFLFLLVSQILFISLFVFSNRFFIPFLPMMALFASQGFSRVSARLEDHRHLNRGAVLLSVLLFLIFFAMPTVYTIFQPKKSATFNYKTPQYAFLISKAEAQKLNQFLRGEVKENDIIWTDLPEILEWEGDRICAWLPTRVEMIHQIHNRIPVDAILLTNIMTPKYMGEEWTNLLHSAEGLPGYKTVKRYQNGGVYAKLLIRDRKD